MVKTVVFSDYGMGDFVLTRSFSICTVKNANQVHYMKNIHSIVTNKEGLRFKFLYRKRWVRS